MTSLAKRPSARLLVLDRTNRVLLFKFSFADGALAGQEFWATPGGALDEGETFEQAAKRELFEETGIQIDAVERHVAEREFILPMPNGEHAFAQERFFVVRVNNTKLIGDNQTAEERKVMTEHRWWHLEDLRNTSDKVFPEDLVVILAGLDIPRAW
jgi:8-oxo-dGTP pyrophosphatase MutT (NUDIX family)